MHVDGLSFEDLSKIRINQSHIISRLDDMQKQVEKTNDLLRQQLTVSLYIKDLLEDKR